MSPDEVETRREELASKIRALLDEYADAAGGDSVDLAVVADWVLVVAVDDAATPEKGNVAKMVGPHQFSHRTLGLLDLAAEGIRQGYFTDD